MCKKMCVTNEEINSILGNIAKSGSIFKYCGEKSYCLEKKYCYKASYLMDKELCDYQNDGNIKYAMFVYDDYEEKNDSNVLYIVIGQNPSRSSNSNIDKTNQCIFKTLRNDKIKVHRYLLLNTFPIIDSNGDDSPDSLKMGENCKVGIQIITELENIGVVIKFIIACGTSLPVYLPFIKIINEYVANGKELYAFSSEKGIQAHMSMQSVYSKNLAPNMFELAKCEIEEKVCTDFINIKILKK